MSDINGRKYCKLIVYGCQGNVSDGERMAGQLKAIGYERTEDMEQADLILINTCCVRETAEDKVYGKIGEIKALKRRKPDLIFGIAGCMAQKEGEALIKRAPHIDFVLGTSKVHSLSQTVRHIEAERGHVVDVNLTETELPDESEAPVLRDGKLSAWVPIMYGCNNFCTYCIVPYVRGRERSRLPEDILREVEQAVKAGYKEVTLLGQNVNSYGKDHKQADFAELLAMVDKVEGIERVRFMTSHPKDLSDKVIEAMAQGKHLAYKDLVKRIRAAMPEVRLTTDLIVGFPGETEEDFEELLTFLKEIRYDAAYTFIYSKRSGTPAAEMAEQVPEDVKKARLQKLMEVQNEISLEINKSLQGKTMEVMVEGPSKNDETVWMGHTRSNKIVLFPHGEEKEGDFVQVKITSPQTWVLKGEVC